MGHRPGVLESLRRETVGVHGAGIFQKNVSIEHGNMPHLFSVVLRVIVSHSCLGLPVTSGLGSELLRMCGNTGGLRIP